MGPQPASHRIIMYHTLEFLWDGLLQPIHPCFFLGGAPLVAFGILSPQPGIESISLQWKHWVLTTGSPGKPPPQIHFLYGKLDLRDKGIWSGSCFIRGMRASGFSSEPSLRPWDFVVTICHVKVLNGTCLVWKYIVTVFFLKIQCKMLLWTKQLYKKNE